MSGGLLNITSVSLQQFIGPIRDQGAIGECAEETAVDAMALIGKEMHLPIPELSSLYLYANTRTAQGTFDTDSGTVPSIMLDQMKLGMAPQSAWSDDPSNLYVRPTADAQSAATIKITGWHMVEAIHSPAMLAANAKMYLDQGRPILFGFEAHQGIMDEASQHTFDAQTGHIYDGVNYGGHMTLLIAASDALGDGYGGVNGSHGGGIMQNSWGMTGVNGLYEVAWDAIGPQLDGHIDLSLCMYVIDGIEVNGVQHNLVWTADRMTVTQGYVALLNRACDTSGLDWWANQHLPAGTLYDHLLASAEEQAIYGNLSNAQFIDNVYINALGRAPGTDVEGRAFWTNSITATHTRGATLAEILSITAAYVDGSNPAYDADCRHSRDLLADKVDVAMHAAVTYGTDNVAIDKVALIGVTDQYASVAVANQNLYNSLG